MGELTSYLKARYSTISDSLDELNTSSFMKSTMSFIAGSDPRPRKDMAAVLHNSGTGLMKRRIH